MITAMNNAYINALLSDAAYVDLIGQNGAVLPENNINDNLALRLTQPLADFITENFTVKDQEINPNDGFSAVVWQGKAGTDYAGKTYVSMRGTADGTDFQDDAELAITGVTHNQLAGLVNWWLKETTPVGQQAQQIQLSLPGLGYHFVAAPSVAGTGGLVGVTSIESINGHSLGGYLATSFERIFGSLVSIGHISTFNSAGFSSLMTQNINEAFTEITNLTGLPVHSGFNSSLQTNYFGENGFEFTTNVWRPIGFEQVGNRIALYQEDGIDGVDPASNHYMFKLTDMLALGDAISKLDNNFTIRQLNNLVKASSNQMEASYERLLDGLRKTIMGGDVFASGVGDTSNGTLNTEPPSRVDFHFRLSQLVDYSGFQDLMGQFTIVNSPASIQEAKGDFGAFLSLVYLTPFALKANDAGGTLYLQNSTFDNTQLAAKWEQDKNLTPAQIANSEVNFTDNWLTDRIAMLAWQNTVNNEDVGDTQDNPYISQGIGKHFYDYDSADGFYVGIQDDNTRQTIFGDETANGAITGLGGDDHLYGGAGNDTLTGNKGNDYLEGNADNDKLIGGKGNDTLVGGKGNDTYLYTTGDGFDAFADIMKTRVTGYVTPSLSSYN